MPLRPSSALAIWLQFCAALQASKETRGALAWARQGARDMRHPAAGRMPKVARSFPEPAHAAASKAHALGCSSPPRGARQQPAAPLPVGRAHLGPAERHLLLQNLILLRSARMSQGACGESRARAVAARAGAPAATGQQERMRAGHLGSGCSGAARKELCSCERAGAARGRARRAVMLRHGWGVALLGSLQHAALLHARAELD